MEKDTKGRAVEAIAELRDQLAADNPAFAEAVKETKEVLIVTASDLRRFFEAEVKGCFDYCTLRGEYPDEKDFDLIICRVIQRIRIANKGNAKISVSDHR